MLRPDAGTAAELAQRYRAKRASPEDVVRRQLARAQEDIHPGQAAATFAQLLPERALREARAAADRLEHGERLGPLDGIPITWKDAFDIAGTPTRMGSRVSARTPAARDAACVARLCAAGAVSLAKTHLSEFAFSGLGINPHVGTPLQRAPRTGAAHLLGGSSSGAAAALRRGVGCIAVGTDTSGSVRVPAAWSGLMGFRPSQQRYGLDGVAPLAPSLDTVGLLAHTVADLVLADEVLRTQSPTRPVPPAPAMPTVRFVLVDNLCGADNQAAVRGNCLRFMDRLSRAGLACEHQRLDVLDVVQEAFSTQGTLVAAEAAITLAAYAEPALAAQLDPFVRQRLQAACALPPERRAALLALRGALLREQALAPRHVVYVFPTVPVTAPAASAVATLAQCVAANQQALRHTMPGSFLDMPGLAVPSGVDEAGLPTSVLLSSPQGCDDMLLAAAARLEALQLLLA